MVGKHRDEKENVAAGPGTRATGKILGNFSWALALAGRGNYGRRMDRWEDLRLDRRAGQLEVRCWGHWIGIAGSLSNAAEIALVLTTAVLLAVGSRPVDLAGMPAAPP